MAKRNITLVHASRASVAPLNGYYPSEAEELEITNLLDDGVMKLFRSGDMDLARQRLEEMIATGRETYAAELVLLCCSAVTRPVLEQLRAGAGIPVLKIDEPMTRQAVETGNRIGLIVTFPPTLEVTHKLLEDAAADLGKSIEIVDELIPEAVEAILSGDRETHDGLLVDAADRLNAKNAEVIVLAQVSMAHLVARLQQRTGLPIFSSLETSLAEVRETLDL